MKKILPPLKQRFTGLVAFTVIAVCCFGCLKASAKAAYSNARPRTVNAFTTTISSINLVTTSPTNATSVQYAVTFASAVTGINTGNFSLVASGVTGAGISSLTGSGANYTVTVNTGTGDGTIELDLANSTGISPAISNTLPFAGQSYTIDKTIPTANSLYQSSSNVNYAIAVVGDVITLIFGSNEPIQSSVATIGGHSVTAVNTGGNNYKATYTMTSADPNGRVHFTVQFTDLAGNVSVLYNDLGAGDDVEFDKTAPSASDVSFVSNNSNTATAIIGNTVTLTFTASVPIQAPPVTIAGHTVSAVNTTGNTYTATYTLVGTDASGNIPFEADLIGTNSNKTIITNVTTSDNVLFNNTPTVSISGTLTALATVQGTPSSSISFTVSGFNLSAGILVKPPTGFELSTDNVNFSNPITVGTGGVIPSTLVYIRLAANDIAGTYAANDILASSPFATEGHLAVAASTVSVRLNNLLISSGTLSPAFASGTTSYTAGVANTVSSLVVTPQSADGVSAMKVNGTAVVSPANSVTVHLNTGPNTITVLETSQDGTQTKTYTVTVTRALSSNANLSNIVLSSGTLSPAFSSAGTAYTASVTNDITTETVTPTTYVTTSTVTVNGTAVPSGTAATPVPLIVGANLITFKVTAEDGTIKTIKLTVTRAPSSNAGLANLALNMGTLTPVFATGTTAYTASVTNTTTSVKVTPTVSDAGAVVKVNNVKVVSGVASGSISLVVGPNTITMLVTAQDGTTTQTYTVTVTRAASANANLANLAVSSGTLNPTFTSATMVYADSVINTVTSIKVTPTKSEANATITVNNTAVNSGTASASIALVTGTNTITIKCIAQNGTVKTYKINVVRALSANANLANLTISEGTLTPTFATATTNYTASVGNAITSLTITPTTSEAHATFTVNAVAATGGVSVPLSVGNNAIKVLVTAQTGIKKTYMVIVNRASAGSGFAGSDIPTTFADTRLSDDGIKVHQGLSPNGDGANDILIIEGLAAYPDNTLSIINRGGEVVFEANGYDNTFKVFDGHSNKTGKMQIAGTYFYNLQYKVVNETRHKTGYIVLKY